MTIDRTRVADALLSAGEAMTVVVARIGPGQWTAPGLGEWNVRELVGHASRALTTTVEYLVPEPPPGEAAAVVGGLALDDDDPVRAAGAYFGATVGNASLSAQVAARGREAGAALGDDPVAAVAACVAAAAAAVRTAPPTAAFTTRFGLIGFSTYLCTRTVEAVVHTLDIAAACAIEAEVPPEAERLVLSVLVEAARHRRAGPAVMRALGGREALPEAFSLFG